MTVGDLRRGCSQGGRGQTGSVPHLPPVSLPAQGCQRRNAGTGTPRSQQCQGAAACPLCAASGPEVAIQPDPEPCTAGPRKS